MSLLNNYPRFGSLISFNNNLFYLVFCCQNCKHHKFFLKDKNPTLGLTCKSCNNFYSVNSKSVLFLRSNDDHYYYSHDFTSIDSTHFLKPNPGEKNGN